MDNNRKSGFARFTVSYEQQFAAIPALDDSVEPEVIGGVRNVVHKERMHGSPGISAAAPEDPDEASASAASTSCHKERTGATTTNTSQERPRVSDMSLRPSTHRMKHVNIIFEKMAKLHMHKELKRE